MDNLKIAKIVASIIILTLIVIYHYVKKGSKFDKKLVFKVIIVLIIVWSIFAISIVIENTLKLKVN